MTNANGRRMPECYLTLWRLVSRIGWPRTLVELHSRAEITALVRERHYTLAQMLDDLVRANYLRCDNAGRFQAVYWFARDCRLPEGEPMPEPHDDRGMAKAGTRRSSTTGGAVDTTPLFQPIPVATPAFDYLQCPSRRGNVLVYRDGHKTDLDGNPV